MSTTPNQNDIAATPTGVGDAVGVPSPKWYVAIVNNNSEKDVRRKLSRLGYDSYVATQQQTKVWRNGRRARVEAVVIRTIVFVRCTEKERRLLVTLPYINRFMTNRAVAAGRSLAVVPDREMHTLQFILGNSDTPVTVEDTPLRRGDRVKVLRGSLMGLEGEIIDSASGTELVVRLDILGCARLNIDRINVEPASPPVDLTRLR